jgi:hypothetical protein
MFQLIHSILVQSIGRRMVRATCLYPMKSYSFSSALALLKLLNFKASEQRLDLLLEANIGYKHANANKHN